MNEVYQWGQGTAQPSRVNFNNPNGGGSPSRWQTHDARVNVVQVAAAKNHSVALSSVGQVFTWGFGADNLGEREGTCFCVLSLRFTNVDFSFFPPLEGKRKPDPTLIP